MAALMTFADVAWEAVVCFGEPVAQIAPEVIRLPSSLVISGFRRLFISTVVDRLTCALPCPMLVVKPGDADNIHGFSGFGSTVIGCDAHGPDGRLDGP